LNALLVANDLTVSKSAEAEQRASEARAVQEQADWQRWLAATPPSIRRFDRMDLMPIGADDVPEGARAALAAQFPSTHDRIAALLEWYGSGAGPWSGFPAYEDEAALLLFDNSTAVILTTIAETPMSDQQWEGAARFFGSWDFRQKRPHDLKLISPKLKAILLQHSLRSGDLDKVERARKAFGH
jgi:hypothetical protein